MLEQELFAFDLDELTAIAGGGGHALSMRKPRTCGLEAAVVH